MAIDSRDPDGDSEMASSAGSVHTETEGPDNGARTPTRHANAAASELSPPGSQSQQIPALSATNDFKGAARDGQTDSQGSEQPIAAWKSKRAQDEYQRAMEYVIDKDFSLQEFGDPFDERDLNEKAF